MESSIIQLSKFRFEKAIHSLETSMKLYEDGEYEFALNRMYYSIFDAIRAITALDGFDSSKHSGIISYFNLNYVKTGLFNQDTAKIIKKALTLREKSDYEDFFSTTKEETKETLDQVIPFIDEVKHYLISKGII